MLEKQTIKNYDITTIIIATLLFVGMMASFGGVAEASSHDVVDIEDGSYTEVQYEDTVEVTGASFGADKGFVLEDDEGNIIGANEIFRDNGSGFVAPTTTPSNNFTLLSENGALDLSTNVFDSVVTGDTLVDPRGDYTIRNAISGTLAVSDQDPASGSGPGEIVIDEVRANVPYDIRVINTAGTNNQIGEEVGFEAGEGYDDFGLELNGSNTVSDGDPLEVRLVHSETGDTLTAEDIDSSGNYGTTSDIKSTLEIDTSETTLSANDAPNDMSSYIYEFELISKNGKTASGEPREYVFNSDRDALSDFNDSIILNDAISEKEGKVGVYFGQTLVLGLNKNEVENSAEYRVRRVDEEDGTALQESLDKAIEDNNISVNERMVRINTDNLGSEDLTVAEYQLREDGDPIFNFSMNRQTIDSSANDSFVNLETSDDTANLNITSDRIGFDVILTSDQLNQTELMDIIEQSKLQANGSDAFIENEENESVRVTDLVGAEYEDQIPLDFSGREAGDYGFQIEVADTGVQTNTTFNVDYGPSGQASFDKGTYREEQGDKINMTISFSETDTATFKFVDEDYTAQGEDSLDLNIEDTDGSDSVTLTFDTYLADETDNGSISFIGEGDCNTCIITAHNGEISMAGGSTAPTVAGRLSTGIYDMEMEVNGRTVDQSVINLVPRETEEVNTWVLPSTEITGGPDVDDISELGTQKSTIANGDWLVFEIKASGIYNERMLNNNTKPSALVNYEDRDDLTGPADIGPEAERMPELHVEVEGERPAPNEDEPRLLMEKADNIQVAPENETFYAFFETSNTDNYKMFANGFSVDSEDVITNYTASLNVTEDYKLVDDENNSADMNSTYEVVERNVDTNMTQVITNEEGLSSRFGIRAVNNSTVKGDTHIAPGSEFTLYVTSTEGADTIYKQRDVVVEEKNNSKMGMVSSQFDFADAEVGRNMSIQFSPINPEQNATIVQPDQPPVIESIEVNSPVSAGEEVTFDPVINNSNPSTLVYDWDFDYNNSSSSAPEPTFVYEENGTYNVSLTVEDPKNRTDSGEVSVVVEQSPNNPPVIRNTIIDDRLQVGEEGDFAAVATDDTSTGSIIYEWDFGDGNTATGLSTTHSYATQGVYNVTVTATDEDGGQSSETQRVQVEGSGNDSTGVEFDVTINTVDDTNGEPIPSASITVLDSNSETVAQSTTNTTGAVTVSVPNGEYQVSASADGYSRNTVSGLQVQGSSVDEFEVRLQPSSGGDTGGTNNSTGDDEDNPDQPGFTLLFGAVALAAAGGIVYRRREGEHSVDKI